MKRQLLVIGVLGVALLIQPDGRAQQQTAPRTPGQTNPPDRNQPSSQPRTLPDAQRSPTPGQGQNSDVLTTPSFVQKVAEDNRMELELARMATTRAQSAQVKSFAQQLVKDHTNSMNTLQKYASKHNITFPQGSSTASNSSSSRSNSNTSNTSSNTTRNDTSSNSTTRNDTNSNSTTRSDTARNSQPDAMASTDAHSRELSSKNGAEFDRAFVDMMVQDHQKAVALFEKQKQARDADPEIQKFVNDTLPVLRRHLATAESLDKSTDSTKESNTSRNPSNTKTSPSQSPSQSPTKTR